MAKIRWESKPEYELTDVPGVGKDYSKLLRAAGIGSVKQLGNRSAFKLAGRLAEVNREQRVVKRAPGLAEVERWVRNAKQLGTATQNSAFKRTAGRVLRMPGDDD